MPILSRFASAILLAAGLLTVAPVAARDAPPGYYTPQKVAYHNDGGAPDNATYFKRLLGNVGNHVEALGKDKVEIRVVSHGDGIALLQAAKTDQALAKRIDALKGLGVRFPVCNNTLRERSIDRDTLYDVQDDDVVPSGVAELARLQGMGFTYIHP